MRLTLTTQRWIALGLVAVGAALGIILAGPDRDVVRTNQPLADIIESRELVVITRNSPTTTYLDREGRTGFEYLLVKAFADYLGVRPVFHEKNSASEVLEALSKGQGHIAAAGLIRTAAREAQFRAGPAYKDVRQQVVCNRYGPVPRTPEDLAGLSLAVTEKSSHDERLWSLAEDVDGLSWTVLPNLNSEEMLEMVAAFTFDCVVADSHVVAINRRFVPELVVPFDLTEPEQLAWLLPPEAEQLQQALEIWFSREETQDLIKNLDEQFYGHTVIFDFVDMMAFRRRIENRLPNYVEWFQDAARQNDLPWTLLAAVGYQESHWVPDAVSPTGVRGLMMLTRGTAGDLGVANREDPEEAIYGGARYLRQLIDRMPPSVPDPDRMWFALAAYNVGFGHVLDARLLAKRLDKDPDSWADLKTVLPLLSKQRYYQDLPHGYARGNEPVVYVRRIRQYLDVLDREFAPALVNIGAPNLDAGPAELKPPFRDAGADQPAPPSVPEPTSDLQADDGGSTSE